MRIPKELEDRIGSPQIICRQLHYQGQEIVVRLQSPLEEPEGGLKKLSLRIDSSGKITEVPDESHIVYGTYLVVEYWSEATKSVVTHGITKTTAQTEGEFNFGARYMLNNSTDDELRSVLDARKIATLIKFTGDNKACGFIEPKVDHKKDKKK